MLGSGSAPAGAKGTRDNEISEPTMETLNGVGREAGEMLGAAGGHRIDRPQTQPARLQPSTRLAAKSQAQSVSDHKWIAMTAECGWIGFHKDANIRRNAVERRTVLDTGARLFCVPRADILAEQVAARYIASLAAIARAARFPGPFIYTVHPSKIVRVL